MNVTVGEAAAALAAASDFLLLTHRSPDGDAIGCAAALCLALRRLGKTAYVIRDPDTSPKLSPHVAGLYPPEGFAPGFVCAVDCASVSQLCAPAKEYADRVDLNIDHHGSNTLFARDTLLESEASAAAELVYEVIEALGLTIDKELAVPLYIGICTDTGCFRHANLTARALRLAAVLIETGIDFYSLHRTFFIEHSKARLALEGLISSRMEYCGPAVFSWYTQADSKAAGATEDDRNDLPNTLMRIEGVKLGLLMREGTEPGEWRLSARAVPGVDVSVLCGELGGGGHAGAAGATVRGSFDEAKSAVLNAAKRALQRAGLPTP